MYFSRTFEALNFDFQIQGLSRTFKVRANPVYNQILQIEHKVFEGLPVGYLHKENKEQREQIQTVVGWRI